jgi:two-component system, cell cycle sensor histidine kinase and response regulator CckA
VAEHPGKDVVAELHGNASLADELAARVRILDANAAALRMLELHDKTKLLGHLLPRFDAATRARAVEFILTLMRSPDTVEQELSVKTFEGRRRHVLMTGCLPARPAWRERVVVSGVDVTDKRLREERSRATQRLEAIGRLAGGVAHDFNNALVVIMSWASLLRKPGRTPEEREEGLDAITGAAARAADLVRRLLSIGRREVRAPRPTSVRALVDETVRSLSRLLPADVRLSVSHDGDYDVVVDEAQLQQVLLNLALNARDAMPQGGLLELQTRACPPEQTTDLDADREYVEISVRDTGVGMDRETQERIFEPFFSTKAEGRGTGLGLATAAAVVAESHGKISVESAPGQGSCFRVALPRAVERVSLAPRLAADSGVLGDRAVLLVEDEDPVRQVLAQALRGAGYRVLEAGDGLSALALLQERPVEVHLLCTDGILPGMPTRQLIDEFRTFYPRAPVLVCSGHVEEELVRRGIASGELSFLAKPFTPDILLRRVGEMLAPRSRLA